MAGKFLGCWLACGLALLVFYGFFGLITSSYEKQWPVMTLVQGMWLHWMFLAIVIALALLGSVVFAAPSSNATIGVIVVAFILFAGAHLHHLALPMGGWRGHVVTAIYFAIPHLEWDDIHDFVVHDWSKGQWAGAVPWSAMAGATVYAAIYTWLLLDITWALFRRKPLSL